ncbi:MAG: DUF3489 domain-containing protein [Marinomonas sp.]|uniref:DUF3489 domain-containing protein n=1 Tax=Parasphingorhabdus sp. TaxID=2709688 RepID=UPI00326A274E
MTKPKSQKTQPVPAAKRETKIGNVVKLLGRKQGATIEELIKTTGWQEHTTRAALTGLKKKGHSIKRDKRGEKQCYRITESVL